MRKDILSVENITMQFGGVVAVNNLSLHIPEGQIVALIGPNGAGKTTAFNCITGVYEPTNGLVKFLDEPMVRNHPTGKMKKLYKGENPLLYTSQYDPGDETKEQMLLRDPLARTGKILSPTPDKITQLGIARTFQNIRLWKSMTVFENVLVAKHMRARQNVFSATFRGNAKEEKRNMKKAPPGWNRRNGSCAVWKTGKPIWKAAPASSGTTGSLPVGRRLRASCRR